MSAESFLPLVVVYEEGLDGAPGRPEVEPTFLRLQQSGEKGGESVARLLQRTEFLEFPFR